MKITGKHELEMPVSIEFEIASAPQPEGIEGLEQIEPQKLQLQIIVNCLKLKKLARTIKKDGKRLRRALDKMKRHGWLVVDQTDCSPKEKTERRGRWIGVEYDGYADGLPVYDLWECSACGIEWRGEETPCFCPDCGAKMDR